LGWGTEFLITADYRIATPSARMGLPETGLGILPGAGGTSELWAMIGLSQALRLGMTGQQIDAEEARRIGLVEELQPDLEAALGRARELVTMVERRSPTAIAAFKAAALAVVGRDPSERQALEALAYEHCVDTGEAAVGRSNFDAVLKGATPPWGPLRRWVP
jgi:enoyl-CoA hydratase/carnithine racemase